MVLQDIWWFYGDFRWFYEFWVVLWWFEVVISSIGWFCCGSAVVLNYFGGFPLFYCGSRS